jgi:hypothetical protein
MISERSRSQREHNRRPDGSANLLPRCANSTRDQKLRLRKFAGLAAVAAMLVLSGRAAERDLDDLLLVATVTVHPTFLSMRSFRRAPIMTQRES